MAHRSGRSRQVDVAARAGVSPAIVSMVINGRTDSNVRMSDATRQRVWDAVHALGYVPNPVARSLAGSRNNLLGVFTFQPVFPLREEDSHYPNLIGIEEEAEAQARNLLLFTHSKDATGQRSIYASGVNCLQIADGALLLGSGTNQEELSRLLREGYPFVFVGRREAPGATLSYVAAGYTEASAHIIRHVAAQGHRRIALIRSPKVKEARADREAGFRLGHHQMGLQVNEGLIRTVPPEGIRPDLLQELLRAGATAVLVQHSRYAMDVLQAARALGLRVPRNFSLAALGDRPNRNETAAGLTSFTHPRQEMGAEAVRLLVEILADGSGPRQITLPCAFVPGRTVAPPPATA